MGATQIFKIIFLILIVLLAATFFVCSFVLGKGNRIDFSNKNTRILLRVRVWCFVAMLFLLLLIVVIT